MSPKQSTLTKFLFNARASNEKDNARDVFYLDREQIKILESAISSIQISVEETFDCVIFSYQRTLNLVL